MRRLVQLSGRATMLFAFIAGGFAAAAYLRIRFGNRWFLDKPGEEIIQAWMSRVARILGLRITVVGEPVSGPALMVANHVSWIDIVALNSVRPMSFLSKDNVRRWPLVGWLSAATGTLFLRRGSMVGLNRATNEIADRLGQGKHVALFPEGTTTDGSRVLPFHRALFRSAQRAKVQVQPVALSYRRNGSRDYIAPFVGDVAFVSHLLRILSVRTTEVQLYFCKPVLESTGDSRVLAKYAQTRVTTILSMPASRAVLAVNGGEAWSIQAVDSEPEPIFRSGS
ncbi:MAG: lysophospholipid acyltransferase family protein [Acidiferrobacteraceae bacterium]